MRVRLNQFLARSGIASRRNSEALITSGQVSVNGQVVTDLAVSIKPGLDVVKVNGETVSLPQLKYYMLNKPVGYTTTRSDPHAEHTIFELLPNDPSLITVGRLDKNTSGLLLITNDGGFAQNVIHPSKKIEKVYRVGLGKEISGSDIQKLLSGVALDDGPAHFTFIEKKKDKIVEVGIEEGRNRIVRRMFEAVGNRVTKLERTKIGKIILDIPIGKFRELTEKERGDYA